MVQRPKIVVKPDPSNRAAIAVSKVIKNPKNSKTAKTAAGLGLAQRRNFISYDSKDRLAITEISKILARS